MQILDKAISGFFMLLIKIYQRAIAPFFISPCRHIPTCSHYGLEALRKHGSLKGTWLIVKRIGHCHPWGSFGFDPVPEKRKLMTAFVSWWQHLPERIDPVFFQLGFIQIRYYGLMYLTSFLVAYGITRRRAGVEKSVVTKQHIDDYISWVIIGVLLGARLGYVIFYNAGYFLSHPLEIFWPLRTIDGELYFGISGMSYHGGLVGAVVASVMFCRRYHVPVRTFADFVIPAVPLGYMFGRIGNFLNGELFGRVTTQWWGMYFPQESSPALRHPSQLYEAFFEGLFLFAVLWNLRRKLMPPGTLFFLYILGYGVVRFFIEFFREPDSQIGFIAGILSMGQLLCLSMILMGLVGIIYLKKSESHGAKNI